MAKRLSFAVTKKILHMCDSIQMGVITRPYTCFGGIFGASASLKTIELGWFPRTNLRFRAAAGCSTVELVTSICGFPPWVLAPLGLSLTDDGPSQFFLSRDESTMTKPENYGQTCVLVRNMPYQCEDENTEGAPITGGVLRKGQVVWVEPRPTPTRHPSRPGFLSIHGYVEHIGVISLDPRFLAWVSHG